MSWNNLAFTFLTAPTRTKLGQLYDNCVMLAGRLTDYAADTGSANVYAASLTPAPAAYTEGMCVRFKAAVRNTGASTINVNSLGAKTIKKNGSSALVAADIVEGMIYTLYYDGTNFQLLNPSNKS